MTRDHFIKIRVTESELADFRARAGEADMTVSDLVRYRLTGYRIRPTDADKDKMRHLSRIGSNINQLARWANSRKAAAPALEVVLWLSRLTKGVQRIANGEKTGHDD